MSRELLDRFAQNNDWIEEEGGPVVDRAGLGSDLVADYNLTPGVFRYLQTLIAGEGIPLPYAPPSVRIVVAKDGRKEDYALVYGFSRADSEAPGYSASATVHPEEAAQFKVYYGANYGPGGYSRVETVQVLDPQQASLLEAGDFTDEEAEQLLAEKDRLMELYWELNVAARDPLLNPGYATRVNASFYQHADAIGF